MLGTITKNDQNYAPIPDNVYLAQLVKVEEKAPPKSHPEWFSSLNWRFKILVDPFKGRLAFGKTPTNWISGKKLDTWLQTLGINVASGTSIKVEDLKDLYVKILVKNDHYQDKVTGENKVFPKVTELLPLDSIDQAKVRELVAGITPVASTGSAQANPTPTFVPQAPTYPQPNVQVGGYVPVTTSAPVSPTPAPVTGTPSRTIPF